MYFIYSYLLQTERDMKTRIGSCILGKVAIKEELGYDGKICSTDVGQTNQKLQEYGKQVVKKITVFAAILTIVIIFNII